MIEAGAFRIAATSLALENTNTLQNAVFKLAQQSGFASSPTTRRVLFALAKSIAGASVSGSANKEHRKAYEDDIAENDETLTLEEIIDHALNEQPKGKVVRRAAPNDLLDRIQREIDWVEERLASGEVARAENGIRDLVLYQLGVSRPEDVAKTLTRIANCALAYNYLEFAERYLNIAEAITHDDSVVLISKARLCHVRGQYNKALSIYDAAIERFPDNAFGYTGRAETLRALGHLNEALAQYDATIERFPVDAVSYRGRAETLRALGRLNEALAQYDAAIERFPTDVVGYNGRAETLRALGRLNEALAQYDATIERLPTEAVGYRGRAETLRALGRLNEALAQYDAAIERFPTDVIGYDGRAETLRTLGRLNEALAQYDSVIVRFPTDAFGYSGRAETLRALERLNEALVQYDAIIERFPTDVFGYAGRAETLRSLGRLNEALAQYDAVIERFPTDAVGYSGRAETLRSLGRLNEALAQYDRTIKRFPSASRARRGRSYILILKGDFAAARKGLAQSSNPTTEDDWIAAHMLGMADLREGNYEAAIDKFGIGSQQCLFATQKKYFLTALSISRLRKSRGEALELEKAEAEIERLKPTMTTPQERGVVLLLSAHAAAAKKNRPKAEQLIEEARIVISAEDFARKRLEREIVRRFQLFEPTPSPLAPSEERQLDDAVFDAEFQLLAA